MPVRDHRNRSLGVRLVEALLIASEHILSGLETHVALDCLICSVRDLISLL